jgi:hypothetical protein
LNRLLSELKQLEGPESLTAWATQALPLKDQRTPGLSMDIPRCTLFKRGDAVVVVNIEYWIHACGNPGNSCATVYVQAHKVGDRRRYWLDGPIELYEVRSK